MQRSLWIILSGIILCAGLLLLVYVFQQDMPPPEDLPTDTPADVREERVSARPQLPTTDEEKSISPEAEEEAETAATLSVKEEVQQLAIEPAEVEMEEDKSELEEFTEKDTEDLYRTVLLDLGHYRVEQGEEFEVQLRLDSPALASLTLIMHYDPQKIAVLPETARAAANVFPGGIEFYADPKTGRMALINGGLPGMKNVKAVSGVKAASFKLLALASGETRISFAPDGTEAVNARGAPQRFGLSGGGIVIE